MSTNLHKTSRLVKFTLHQWNGFRRDKQVTKQVDEQNSTDGTAGNYNKRLFSNAVLKPITTVLSRAKTEHQRMTFPWCFDGVALLPNKLFFEYSTIMRNYKDLLEQQVVNFANQLPIHIANQQTRLGHLFNIEDYPDRDDLLQAYRIETAIYPVPHTSHFLDEMDDVLTQTAKRDLERQLADTQRAALQGLYDRLLEQVEHMHERLSDPGNSFHESMLENMHRTVELLPNLNIFEDPVLDQACEAIKTKLLVTDTKTLRTDMPTRVEVATRAYDVLSILKGKTDERRAA